MATSPITTQNMAGLRPRTSSGDRKLAKTIDAAMKDRVSIGDTSKIAKAILDGIGGKTTYGATEMAATRTLMRAAMRDAGYRVGGKLVVRPNTVIRFNGRRVSFTGPKAAQKFLHDMFSGFGSMAHGKVAKALGKTDSKASAKDKADAKKDTDQIVKAADEFTNAEAAKKLVDLMKEAEAVRPRYDIDMRGSVDVITLGSLQRTLKANKVPKKIRDAAEQAYRTSFGKKLAKQMKQRRDNMIAHNARTGHNHPLPEFPRGQAFDRQLQWGFVRATDSDWSKLTKELTGYLASPRPGKTAKAVIAAKPALDKLDLSKIDGEKDRAKVLQEALGVMFNRSGVGSGGRVNWAAINRYFNSARGKKHTPNFKRLVRATFFYLTKTMGRGRPGVSFCVDQGRMAMEELLKLQPTNRAGSIYAMSQTAAKKGIWRS